MFKDAEKVLESQQRHHISDSTSPSDQERGAISLLYLGFKALTEINLFRIF